MNDWFKYRSIALPGDACNTAAKALAGIDSIEVEVGADERLQLRYDLRQISLAEIEAILAGAGIALAGGWLSRIQRSFRHYTETIQRDCHDIEAGWDAYVRAAYLSRYRTRRHGRRDDRPQQWRQYLHKRSEQ